MMGSTTEAQPRSSGGSARPSFSRSRTPSFGGFRATPRTPSTSGGYSRPGSFGYTGSRRPSVSNSAGDRAFALLEQGERIHVANFPSCAPLGGLHENVNEVYMPAAAHAYEGRLYNVVSQEFGTPELCERLGVPFVPEAWNCISGVIGPDGDWIASLRDEEGIVYADCDPDATVQGRIFHDIVGHYNRFDVFSLTVDRRERRPVQRPS